MPPYRNNREYVKRREALFRDTRSNNTPCHICGKPFDFTLDWKHPMAITADHLTPIAKGGSMVGALAPAHRSCNSRRGTKAATNTNKKQPRTSRNW